MHRSAWLNNTMSHFYCSQVLCTQTLLISKYLSVRSLQSMCLSLISMNTLPAVDFLAGEDVVHTGKGENICGMLEFAHVHPGQPDSVRLYAYVYPIYMSFPVPCFLFFLQISNSLFHYFLGGSPYIIFITNSGIVTL